MRLVQARHYIGILSVCTSLACGVSTHSAQTTNNKLLSQPSTSRVTLEESVRENAISVSETSSPVHILFVHGLNHSPTHLIPLAKAISGNNVSASIIQLSGHNNPLACSQRNAYPLALWRSQLREEIKRYKGKRLFLAGYSLGALLALDALQKNTDIAGVMLFAPPLSLRCNARFIHLLLPLRHLHISLPSFAPRQTRVCSTTPLQYYQALLDLRDHLLGLPPEQLNSHPIMLFLNPEDEFVYAKGVRSWVATQSLSNWQIQGIATDPVETSLPEHLFVDRSVLGEKEWQRVVATGSSFIANHTHQSAGSDT